MKAQHSAKTAEHGTPPHIVEGGRNLMGVIHLDPFSSALWNRRVRALKYYDKRANGFRKPWSGNLLVNPPGGEQGKLVQAAWMRLVDLWLVGDVVQAIFVGFSLEQLVSLQGLKEWRTDGEGNSTSFEYPSPLAFPTVIPRRRLHYQEKKGRQRKSQRSKNPPHASYVSWLPPCHPLPVGPVGPDPHWADADRRFADTFGYLGTIARSIAA